MLWFYLVCKYNLLEKQRPCSEFWCLSMLGTAFEIVGELPYCILFLNEY